MDAGFFIRFFAAYDCGTYGSGGYNVDQACASSGLAATGTDIMIGIGIGVVLLVLGVALVMRIRKKK